MNRPSNLLPAPGEVYGPEHGPGSWHWRHLPNMIERFVMFTSLVRQTDDLDEQLAQQALIGYVFVVGVVALLCALGGQAIGRTKGRERAGFWLGLLLGPFGLILIALLSRTPEAEAEFALRRDAAMYSMSHRQSAPASWLADPVGRHQFRCWDGYRWTEHVSDAGQTGTDKLESH